MVWSLIKIVFFVLLVSVMTLGGAYIIDVGGEVRVALGTMEFSLTPIAGLIGIVLILMAGWIAFRLAGLLVAIFRFFNGDETAISRYFDRNRERRGFEALADGPMALASGEGQVAMAEATKAEKYLQRPDLTLLLSAQAAELTGETGRAQSYYKKLLKDDRTRFVGVQGILKQKLAEGDTDTALKLAEKAFGLRPRHEGMQNTLFALQSEKSDWKGARETLAAKLKSRALPKDVHTRRDAVLALAEAQEKIEEGDMEAGRLAALQANRLSPDLVPAAVLAAEMHTLNSTPKSAVKVLKKAWTVQPHPDLASAWAEIAPDESASERRSRFQPLLKLKPEHSETKMLAAELAIVDEDFPGARKALGDLTETDPTTRSLTIMAAVERGEGTPDNVVRGWLTKALGASRGPQWACSNCNQIHPDWTPVCAGCSSFDTLEWRLTLPVKENTQRPSEMLPLIVGALEKDNEEATQAEDKITPETSDEAKRAKKQDFVVSVEKTSDDMDGILGDPHVVPDIAGGNR